MDAGVLGGPEGVPGDMEVRVAEGVFGSLPFRNTGGNPANSISGDPGGVFNKEPDGIVGRRGIFGRILEVFLGEHSAELGAVVEELDERDDIPEAAEVVDEVDVKDFAELEETERNEVTCLPSPFSAAEESRFLELDLEPRELSVM